MTYFQAIILAIVEGLTEFLPVSSTGHMILASTAMGIEKDEFVKTFTVAIQFGAILSVVVLYWKRFFQSFDFYAKLLVAFIPVAVLGKLLDDYIDLLLGNALVVGVTLLLGGIVLVFMDKWFAKNDLEQKTELKYGEALKVGLFQCLAMAPGVSRSAATIAGGMTQGLTRKAAAEFSFFLAVPTMFAATAYKLFKFYKAGGGFTHDQTYALVIGNVIAFAVAMIAIRVFIGVLTRYGFRWFGYYRIVVGAAVILAMLFGARFEMI